jgi:hypothetical protein
VILAYAIVGYAYAFLSARDRLPPRIDDWTRRFRPWRCDEEIANGGGVGLRGECELLWCWCVPYYWRYSDGEAMDAYWAFHPADDDE